MGCTKCRETRKKIIDHGKRKAAEAAALAREGISIVTRKQQQRVAEKSRSE
jgi:hypothetical protein